MAVWIDIKSNFALLDRAVALFDARFTLRALRSISSIRKRLTPGILAQAISETYLSSSTSANVAKQMLQAIGRPDVSLGRQSGPEMEIDSEPKAAGKNGAKKEAKEAIPEVDV